MPLCPKCHAEIKAHFKFCRQCGAPIERNVVGTAIATAVPSGPTHPAPAAPAEPAHRVPPPVAATPALDHPVVAPAASEATETRPPVTEAPRAPQPPRPAPAASVSDAPRQPVAPPPSPSTRLGRLAQVSRSRRVWASLALAAAVLLVAGAGMYYLKPTWWETIKGSVPGVPSISGLTSKTPSARAEQYVGQGMAYASLKQWDNAVQEFTHAIETSPSYAVAYANRGIAYMQQKKLNLALDDLKKAAELAPKDAMVRYNLASLYAVEGQVDRALQALNQALDLGFNQIDALRSDPDLASLRSNPEFQKILEQHKIFIK